MSSSRSASPEPHSAAQSSERQSGSLSAAASRESRPGLTDATRYDFDRLERAIVALVQQKRSLAAENQALQDRLSQKELDVQRLAGELATAQNRRQAAIDRVDLLIEELDRLDGQLDDAMVQSSTKDGVSA